MTDLNSWWQGLDTLHKGFWAIALLFTLFFVVQTVLTFIGGDADGTDGADDGFDGDMGHQFFTIKNLIAFFTLFGWAGLAALENRLSPFVAILIGAVAGVAMVLLMMWMMRKASHMRHSGTLDINNAVGLTGQVYLPIPAARGGNGKVSLRVQGSLKELDAITDDPVTIPTGSLIKVLGIINGRILLVTSTIA